MGDEDMKSRSTMWTQDFADELMTDQFIAGLTSDAFRVKLIGEGHRHKNTQEKVKLQEVVVRW